MKHSISAAFYALMISIGSAIPAMASPVSSSLTAVQQIHGSSAGSSQEALERQVDEIGALAQKHIATVGLKQAVRDLQAKPWKRDANALHFWGVTTSGMHWFDAGHPEFVGLQVIGMEDLKGLEWWPAAVSSAKANLQEGFNITFPHPNTGKAALGYHNCFMLEDDQRALCAGAFIDQ